MKVKEFTFRDLDRKWVGIENKKVIKKIGKIIKNKKIKKPLFGYFYIDKENGIRLRVVGNIKKDGYNKLYLDDSFILEKEYNIDYDIIEDADVELLSSMVVDNLEGVRILENKVNFHYQDINNFMKTRNMKELDPYRNSQFPDDIQVLLESKNDDADELLWARIEGIMDVRPDILICKLLNDSYYNADYKENTMVGVKYFETEDKLKIYGLLKKREKNSNGGKTIDNA